MFDPELKCKEGQPFRLTLFVFGWFLVKKYIWSWLLQLRFFRLCQMYYRATRQNWGIGTTTFGKLKACWTASVYKLKIPEEWRIFKLGISCMLDAALHPNRLPKETDDA